jgi:hypothetical protein
LVLTIYDLRFTIFLFLPRLSAVNEFEKTKPISRPSAGNTKSEYLNPKRFDGYVLKKQTQLYLRQNERKCV